jgi:hypothetical protein
MHTSVHELKIYYNIILACESEGMGMYVFYFTFLFLIIGNHRFGNTRIMPGIKPAESVSIHPSDWAVKTNYCRLREEEFKRHQLLSCSLQQTTFKRNLLIYNTIQKRRWYDRRWCVVCTQVNYRQTREGTRVLCASSLTDNPPLLAIPSFKHCFPFSDGSFVHYAFRTVLV